MAKQAFTRILGKLRAVAAVQSYRDVPDCELLDRFIETRDEGAFAVLVERHGPMVLGVCRRALPSYQDAEDACQATLLVLARKAAVVRKKGALGTWLQGVACRVVASSKRQHARRQAREQRIDIEGPREPAAELSWREAQTILDEEIQRLPERYRAPTILCYLECLTRDDAARQLGVSPTTLHGRLERGRDLLRNRLTRRGLTLSTVMAAAMLSGNHVHAALPATFVVSSTKAAMLLAGGQSLAGSGIATPVHSLLKEALKTMFLTKLKLAAMLLCAGLFMVLIAGAVPSAVVPAGVGDSELPKARRPAVALEEGEPGRETKAKKAEKEPGVLRGILDQVDAEEKVITVTLPAIRGIKDGKVATGKSVRLENLVVGKITKITVDGKEDKIANLKPGMPVHLEIEVSFGQIVVKRLDAKDKE